MTAARWPWRKDRPKPYRERDFRRRERFRDDYLAVAVLLDRLLDFRSVYDVGCANGFLLEGFLAADKEVAGIEASAAVRGVLPESLVDRVRVGDFAEATGAWDLVCCVEVAEHIPPERSEELVSTLARLATGSIYFTAAPPGQTGRGHINCRPHAEWLGWLADAGWPADEDLTTRLRDGLASLVHTPWLRQNSFVLRPVAAPDG